MKNDMIDKDQMEAREAEQNDMPQQQVNQSIQNNPFSNGTGSGRPVFNDASQNVMGQVQQGQNLGNLMFNQQNPLIPQTPNSPLPQDPNVPQ
jgi:hypothetical protein